jgi:hypothetical protein
MGIHYDWNVEIIAQFYATLYIEYGGGTRRMHWMTEGDWYHISYNDFASRFSFGTADAHHRKLHIDNPLDLNEMKFMYTPGLEGNTGTINILYTFYSVINRLFRKTICPRDVDPTNISQFAKNLLTNMRDGVLSFSVMDFVWEEIKGISMNPQKTCGFAPYLMFIIKDVTGKKNSKKGKHMPFRPNPTKKPLIPPAQVSFPPRADPTPQQQQAAQELIRLNRDSLRASSERNPPPLWRKCSGSCLSCVALNIPFKLGFMRRGKPTRSSKKIWRKSRKLSILTRLLLRALKKERVTPLHLLSSAMQAMKALIHLSHLLPMLAHLT